MKGFDRDFNITNAWRVCLAMDLPRSLSCFKPERVHMYEVQVGAFTGRVVK